ncbi:NAD(P)-dependent oxidoreductase [Roseomonas populi]|uniref:3-phosphoglycerate dehydrogenase n=1 Tax=Roseomonas populi TaxID=3121582 RepID=A0ABT1WZ04_9PROT|nr:NAD(P)-dependent oxidoreductase [Roseomonas pecuniae]MCR0981081.1 3-phosphoglycerate dehydrogenase [Roseomonas pecuniae]
MTPHHFRVGYLERPMNEAFLTRAAEFPALDIRRIGLDQPEAAIAAALAECHGYYAWAARHELPLPWHVTPALLARLPRLLVVASYGAGYDTIDVDACTAAGVAVVNQAGGNAEGVAEHALGMMLLLLKRVPEAQAAMRAGTVRDRNALMGRELAGRTVGLVGLGHVGTRMAALLNVFGCRVLAVDPALDAATIAARGATKVEMPVLLASSDIVSLHCPLTAQTRGMIGAEAIGRMRPGAFLVTTARGFILDEAALLAALREGRLGGAGLDVWEEEPPPASHPLLAHPAVLASPHTAGVTAESRARVASMAAEAFAAAVHDLPPRLVNPEVTDRFLARRRALLDVAA